MLDAKHSLASDQFLLFFAVGKKKYTNAKEWQGVRRMFLKDSKLNDDSSVTEVRCFGPSNMRLEYVESSCTSAREEPRFCSSKW
jgi:hypothetical protein